MTPAPGTPSCPNCGSHAFKLYATRNVRVDVTFSPGGDTDIDNVRHDDLEWDDQTFAECLDCPHTAELGQLSGRTAPPMLAPVRPRVWAATGTWAGRSVDLGLHQTGESAQAVCLAHAGQHSDGQPPEQVGQLCWRLRGPWACPVVTGAWEDLTFKVSARPVQ